MMGLKRKSIEQPPPEVRFSEFQSLIQAIAAIEPKPIGTPHSSQNETRDVFRRWVVSLGQNRTPQHGAIVFRLLFPELDSRRRYDLKETRLGRLLATHLEVPTNEGARGYKLRNWIDDNTNGCLGDEVRCVMMHSPLTTPVRSISLTRVDELLDELACHSSFSEPRVSSHRQPRSQAMIISDLFSTLVPSETATMTQIILQDLRPILYPAPANRTRANLVLYNSNSFQELSFSDALYVWDSRLPRVFKVRSTLDAAFSALSLLEDRAQLATMGPELGIQVQIPKCLKGQGCDGVIKILSGPAASPEIWAETKYDGERMQIHVDLTKDSPQRIRIFSKSGRDSTLDRIATHSIIESALALSTNNYDDPRLNRRASTSPIPKTPVCCSVILEAEMVCFDEGQNRIDEFWRIRSLIEHTSDGARARFRRRNDGASSRLQDSSQEDAPEYDESLRSSGADHGNRHFMLVFFDILALESQSLLNMPYEYRREKLEQTVRVIHGYSTVSKRVAIKLSDPDAVDQLRSVFSQCLTDREEGLVLKPSQSTYNAMASRWIKLKADYIPGLGDTLDLAIIGACWEKDRGRSLRVTPSTMTTFFVAAVDKEKEKRRGSRSRPHFEVLFHVSYGLSRDQLEEFNWEIEQSVKYKNEPSQLRSLSYTFSLPTGMVTKPTTLFSMPKLVEVYGAGFSKCPGAHFYELRFPRISKIWRQKERQWIDGVTLQQFQEIACEALGRDTPQKLSKDVINNIWKQPTSPGARSHARRSQRQERLLMMLKKADGQGSSPKRHEICCPASPRKKDSTPVMSPKPRKAFGSSTNAIERCPISTNTTTGPHTTPYISFPAPINHNVTSSSRTSVTEPYSPLLKRFQPLTPATSSPSKGLIPSITETAEDKSDHLSMLTRRLICSKSKVIDIPKENIQPTSLGKGQIIRLTTSPALEASPLPNPSWTLQGSLFFVHPPIPRSGSTLTHQPTILTTIERTFQDQRVRSLDALLWGTGWKGPSRIPPRFERGFVFIDDSDENYLSDFILALEGLSPRTKYSLDIHIFPMKLLPSFYSSKLFPVSATPLWSSSHIVGQL